MLTAAWCFSRWLLNLADDPRVDRARSSVYDASNFTFSGNSFVKRKPVQMDTERTGEEHSEMNKCYTLRLKRTSQ